LVQWSTSDWFFFDDDTSSLIEALVDTTHSISRGSNFSQEDWLLESWLSGKLSSVVDSSGSWDDLTTTSVDSVVVEDNIDDVHSDTSHLFFGHGTFLGGPLEGRLHGILDFVHELNSLGDVDKDVWSLVIRSERPDLLGISLVPAEIVAEGLLSFLGVILWSELSVVDEVSEFVSKRLSGDVKSVVLIGRLGQADLAGGGRDGFLVGDEWVGDLDFAVSVFLLEIVQANFDVELTATGNNVLAVFFSGGEDERVRLGELLETFNELWQVGGVLWLDGDSDDRGDGVFHDSDTVGVFVVGDGTGLKEVLIDTEETDGVTARDIRDVLDGSAHHEDSSLDGLFEKIVLLAWDVVRSHNSDLLAGVNGTTEDSTESEESTLIGGWHHLGDVHHKSTLRVTFSHGGSDFVVLRTFVEVGGSVFLGDLRGWEVEHHHFKKSVSSVDPSGHDELKEVLASEFLFLRGEGDFEGGKHLVHLVGVTVHNGAGELDNRLHDESAEGSLEVFTVVVDGVLEPFLGLRVKVVVTPEFLHHLFHIDLEFLGVDTGESGEGEGPAFFTRTEGDVTLVWIEQEVTHIRLFVVGNDDVDQIDDSDEVLVHFFSTDLKLEDLSIDLVNHQNWSDLLSHSLTKDSFGLDADTFDAIDNDESTVSDSESGCDFRGEVDVSRRIDKIDKVRLKLAIVIDVVLVVHGDTSGLDGDTSFLLVFSGIGVSGVTGHLAGNNTSLSDQGVRKGGLSVIDVSNDGHVSDVGRLVHNLSDLFDSEVDHLV